MILSLDVRRARKGDCFMLHYGTADTPCLMLIDGGPAGVYRPHLRPRIEEIRHARRLAEEQPLTVDRLMVSHVDDDHIRGLLDLTRDEIERADAHRPLLLNVLGFWHNSFTDVIGDTPAELVRATRRHFEASAGGEGLSDAAELGVAAESEEALYAVRAGLKVLASIEQGARLRDDAERLGYPLNPEFGGGLIIARPGGEPLEEENGLTLTVVGPMEAEIAALHRKHQEWLRTVAQAGGKPEAALAAYVDKSVANLSSIVVLAEAGERSILLTGDARGDKILEGLELTGRLEPGETMHVDILKVPHHGSANNLEMDFFSRIVADHYVFSGDGEHGNPERESLEMLFAARGRAPFEVHLTYPVGEIDLERRRDWEKEQRKEEVRRAKRPATRVRPDWSDEQHGLAAFLDQVGLADGQTIRIVGDDAHVIDLLDPVGF
jgi:hypothetical protein